MAPFGPRATPFDICVPEASGCDFPFFGLNRMRPATGFTAEAVATLSP